MHPLCIATLLYSLPPLPPTAPPPTLSPTPAPVHILSAPHPSPDYLTPPRRRSRSPSTSSHLLTGTDAMSTSSSCLNTLPPRGCSKPSSPPSSTAFSTPHPPHRPHQPLHRLPRRSPHNLLLLLQQNRDMLRRRCCGPPYTRQLLSIERVFIHDEAGDEVRELGKACLISRDETVGWRVLRCARCRGAGCGWRRGV